jgi:hypothetical protein
VVIRNAGNADTLQPRDRLLKGLLGARARDPEAGPRRRNRMFLE